MKRIIKYKKLKYKNVDKSRYYFIQDLNQN